MQVSHLAISENSYQEVQCSNVSLDTGGDIFPNSIAFIISMFCLSTMGVAEYKRGRAVSRSDYGWET